LGRRQQVLTHGNTVHLGKVSLCVILVHCCLSDAEGSPDRDAESAIDGFRSEALID